MNELTDALALLGMLMIVFGILNWLDSLDWSLILRLFVAPVAIGLLVSWVFPSDAHPLGWPIMCATLALFVWMAAWEQWTTRRRQQH